MTSFADSVADCRIECDAIQQLIRIEFRLGRSVTVPFSNRINESDGVQYTEYGLIVPNRPKDYRYIQRNVWGKVISR
jgi:hypothetical protein